MTSEQKLARLRALLGNDSSHYTDATLNEYLDFAEEEIINQVYAITGLPETPSMPSEYNGIQIFAVVNGLNTQGAESETTHGENGITRTFKYPDMVQYIRNNVFPYVKVVK